MPYDLYVITDETLAGGLPHVEIARRAVAGGADVIQLRDKALDCRELVRIGREIHAITKPAGALFIVNDRLDVAIACGAGGVHLGQGDIGPGVARQLAPPGFVIGVSVGNAGEALQVETEGADYVVLSPTFATGSKSNAGPGHGLVLLAEIRNAVTIPVIAIGGIGPGNVRDVIRAGADGVAVISAVVSAPDITRAAQEMRSLIGRAKQEMRK
ncbi:MAG: thiamine phosphate synthase [Methanoregula sp.]|jgi:thiamine-phosphate pyrophosphorylase|nr:thiamine phosphate synthase [Methanoregula sp.]